MKMSFIDKSMIDDNFWRQLLVLSFSMGTAFGYGVTAAVTEYLTGKGPEMCQQASGFEANLTLTEYEQLELGMSIAEVRAILGRGIEISQTESTVVLVWKNPNGSGIVGTFEGGYLANKQQDLMN